MDVDIVAQDATCGPAASSSCCLTMLLATALRWSITRPLSNLAELQQQHQQQQLQKLQQKQHVESPGAMSGIAAGDLQALLIADQTIAPPAPQAARCVTFASWPWRRQINEWISIQHNAWPEGGQQRQLAEQYDAMGDERWAMGDGGQATPSAARSPGKLIAPEVIL